MCTATNPYEETLPAKPLFYFIFFPFTILLMVAGEIILHIIFKKKFSHNKKRQFILITVFNIGIVFNFILYVCLFDLMID